jgi:hypothetical protein
MPEAVAAAAAAPPVAARPAAPSAFCKAEGFAATGSIGVGETMTARDFAPSRGDDFFDI